MTRHSDSPDDTGAAGSNNASFVTLLECATGFVLGLVILAVGWILAASAAPELATTGRETLEVSLVLGLLTLALGLVTVVALLHTRGKKRR